MGTSLKQIPGEKFSGKLGNLASRMNGWKLGEGAEKKWGRAALDLFKPRGGRSIASVASYRTI